MNIIELYDNISRGGEIEFIYKGKNYSITHSEEGIHIMEAYNYDSEVIYEKSTDIGGYSIDGETLKDFFEKVEITFRCF